MRQDKGKEGRHGPRLPFSLVQEITSTEGHERPGWSGKRGRGDRGRGGSRGRARFGHGERPGRGGRRSYQETDFNRKRGRDHDGHRPGKRGGFRGGRPSSGGGSRFEELLQEGPVARVSSQPVVSRGEEDAEARYQASLIKKLGIQGRNKDRKVGDLGLDEMLGEFEMGNRGLSKDASSQKTKTKKLDDDASDDSIALESSSDEEEEEEGLSASEEEGIEADSGTEEPEEEESEEEETTLFQSDESDDDLNELLAESDEDDEELLEEELEDDDAQSGTASGSEAELDDEDSALKDAAPSSTTTTTLLKLSSGADAAQDTHSANKGPTKYVPPALRQAAGADGESDRVSRAVRGLLNRLAESNIQGIIKDLCRLYQESGRRQVTDCLISELVSAAAEGPRATEAFAAVAAAAAAALAASVNNAGVLAGFLAAVASRLESAASDDDGLAVHNLTLVIAQLYMLRALSADLVFSLLRGWSERFSERDIAAMAKLLSVCGLGLRSSDPQAMRDVIVTVTARVAANNKQSDDNNGSPKDNSNDFEPTTTTGLSARARALLDIVTDTKNNRRRDSGQRAAALAPVTIRWVRSLGLDAVSIGGISWTRVLEQPKRGHWWLPTAADAKLLSASSGQGSLPSNLVDTVLDDAAAARRLSALATKMGMNTDVRRAVFCAIMGGEDVADAIERIGRLRLRAQQAQEPVRIATLCALGEASYNPYYAAFLCRLATADRNQGKMLQFRLWDLIRELTGEDSESSGIISHSSDNAARKLGRLARLTGACLAQGALRPGFFKIVSWRQALTPRETVFWRLVFQTLLSTCQDPVAFFAPLATRKDRSGSLRKDLAWYFKHRLGPWLAEQIPKEGGKSELENVMLKARSVERALKATVVA